MRIFLSALCLSFLLSFAHASVPVPYAGKVSVDGKNFHGQLKFMFAIYTKSNDMVWDSGDSAIEVPVSNGRYLVLLGGQGMTPLPASLFHENDELYVGVYADLPNDNVGQVKLGELQRITAQPYALVAEMAKIADVANSAKAVEAGAITKQMLGQDVLSDLNRTVTKSMLGQDVLSDLNRTVTANQMAQNTITTTQLNEQILKYLKPEITHTPQAPSLIFGGQTVTLLSQAEGKYLSYQWYKNGQPIAGATDDRYVIDDINKTQHDGNYSLMVSNDFGTVTTQSTQLVVDGTPTSHTVASISMDMIFCPPGTFTMGSPTSETGRGGDETQHSVTLTNGFYLGKYEVTQAQYQTVMNGNPAGLNADPSQFKGSNRPVERVSWEDVQVFLSHLNAIEQTAGRLPAGWKYVLPTEAQWEYACRAGTTTAYSWGNDINSSRANYNWDGAHNTGNDFKQTRDVGQYAANPWGFFDMHGNLAEWVYDWKANYFTGAQTDPEGPASGSNRVARGGSWYAFGTSLRSAKRNFFPPSNRATTLGFRVGFQAIQPDTANPEMELIGGAAITREAGQAWTEPGVEAHDARDGNITDQIVVTGTVDMNSTGTYLLTYTVQDGAGNSATATRTVTVVGNRTVDLNATVAMDMIWCPPGTFTMGSPITEVGRGTNETEHNVSLTRGFYLGKYEVTQAQYEAVMTGNSSGFDPKPSYWPNNPNHPVNSVSWNDCKTFITRLNQMQSSYIPVGWEFALPTEAQWEYACRAGTKSRFSWGDDVNSSLATYNSDGFTYDSIQTTEVGYYEPNPWGFYDMHGNLFEWIEDWFGEYPSGNPLINPTGATTGSSRVIRGSSWKYSEIPMRSASRWNRNPSESPTFIGFRVSLQKSQ